MSNLLMAFGIGILVADLIVALIVRRNARSADELMTEYLSLGWYGESLHKAIERPASGDEDFTPEQELAFRESWRRRLEHCKAKRAALAKRLRITQGQFEWEAD